MGQTQNKTIIFVETKKKVDEITRKLRYAGWVDVPLVHVHSLYTVL